MASSLRAMLHEQVGETTLQFEPAEVEAIVSGVSEEDTWQRKKEHDATKPSCGPCQ